jgi:hypothetical protein
MVAAAGLLPIKAVNWWSAQVKSGCEVGENHHCHDLFRCRYPCMFNKWTEREAIWIFFFLKWTSIWMLSAFAWILSEWKSIWMLSAFAWMCSYPWMLSIWMFSEMKRRVQSVWISPVWNLSILVWICTWSYVEFIYNSKWLYSSYDTFDHNTCEN